MLTSITVVVQNNPYLCGIELASAVNVQSVGDITSVVIYRKEGEGVFEVVGEIEVTQLSDLTFDILDAGTKSGTPYTYSIDVMQGDTIAEFQTYDPVLCAFEGLFIGNEEAYYIAGTNFKTETKRNIQREYVKTLSGRYPYAISNADTDYTSGTSTGLFLQLTQDRKKFLPDTYHSMSDRVIDFLCDGTPKILKTHDGQVWYVSIDASPNTVYSEFIGNNAVQFGWTEIDDVPLESLIYLTGEHSADGSARVNTARVGMSYIVA